MSTTITPPLFRYAFRYYDGPTSTWMYYLILGGAVDVDNVPRWLTSGPSEWAEEGASVDRDFEYFGMMIVNGTPMSWTHEPARILRHIFLTQGIEGKCDLYIEMFNSDPSIWVYEQYLPDNFSLDFSTFVSEYDWVKINAMEGGFVAKLKARGDTQYEIEVANHPDVKYIKNDGIELQAKMNWIGIFGEDCNSYPTLAFTDTEGTNITFHPYTQSEADPHVQLVTNTSGASADVDMYFKWSFSINQTSGYLAHMKIDYITYDVNTFVNIATIPIYYDATGQATGTTQAYSGDNTQTITLGNNVGMFIMFRMYVTSPAGYVSDGSYICLINSLTCNGYLINRFETTYHPVLKASKVFEELTTLINDYPYNIPSTYSDLLGTTFNDEIYITCGDAIRNLEGSKMKISFNQLFKMVKKENGAAYYDYDLGRFYINDLTYVFKQSLHTDLPSLGTAKTCKVLPFSTQQFVNFVIGSGSYNYDAQKNNDLEITNGKDEINQNYNFLSSITRVKRDANYVTEIRQDCHGIEEVRINFSGKTISESSSDNDLFAMHCTKDPVSTFDLDGVTTDYYDIIRTPIDLTPGASFFNIENVFSPSSIYNVIFFPIKSIYRCGAWFRSLLKFHDTEYLKFQSSSKNNASSLKAVISEGSTPDVYDANADILVSSLCDDGREHFYPLLLEFELEEPINLYQKFIKDKYAFMNVTYLGNTYKVWAMQVTSKPANRGTTKFVGIPTIDNDLTLLER